MLQHALHDFPPFIDSTSEILILGSFPSVLSRKHGFFYMHPQNRFWKVLSAIFQDDFVNASIDTKSLLLKRHHIALYDVIESCDIEGSKDSSIKNIVPTDVQSLIETTAIKHIYLNGQKAYSLFVKYNPNLRSIATSLHSTSPANAAKTIEDLVLEWKVISQ